MCNRIPLRSCGGVFSIRFAKADRMIVGIERLRTGNDQVVGLTRQSASSCQSEPITLNLRRGKIYVNASLFYKYLLVHQRQISFCCNISL
jgi:hypothetical protein